MKIVSLSDLPEVTTSHNKTGKKKIIISANELPHIHQLARVSFGPGEVVEQHSHKDYYEFMIVEHGEGVIKINGTEYDIEKDSCVTVSPNEKHEVINTGKEPLILTVLVGR